MAKLYCTISLHESCFLLWGERRRDASLPFVVHSTTTVLVGSPNKRMTRLYSQVNYLIQYQYGPTSTTKQNQTTICSFAVDSSSQLCVKSTAPTSQRKDRGQHEDDILRSKGSSVVVYPEIPMMTLEWRTSQTARSFIFLHPLKLASST